MRPNLRLLIEIAAVVMVVTIGAFLSTGPEDVPVASSSPEDAAPEPAPAVSAGPPAFAPTRSAARATAPDAAGTSERMALLQTDPVLLDRARQHELAPEADERWSEAVDEGRYTAEDVDVAVREAFSTIELEPRYAEDGMIEGLTIRSMQGDHPFARAGLREGDRLERIHGVDLRDPAELPALFARLGPEFEVCARESLGCVTIVLD